MSDTTEGSVSPSGFRFDLPINKLEMIFQQGLETDNMRKEW